MSVFVVLRDYRIMHMTFKSPTTECDACMLLQCSLLSSQVVGMVAAQYFTPSFTHIKLVIHNITDEEQQARHLTDTNIQYLESMQRTHSLAPITPTIDLYTIQTCIQNLMVLVEGTAWSFLLNPRMIFVIVHRN